MTKDRLAIRIAAGSSILDDRVVCVEHRLRLGDCEDSAMPLPFAPVEVWRGPDGRLRVADKLLGPDLPVVLQLGELTVTLSLLTPPSRVLVVDWLMTSRTLPDLRMGVATAAIALVCASFSAAGDFVKSDPVVQADLARLFGERVDPRLVRMITGDSDDSLSPDQHHPTDWPAVQLVE